MQLGGRLVGDGSGALLVGYSDGSSNTVLRSARGTVNATGVAGSTSYEVGVLFNEALAGSVAEGHVTGVGAGQSSAATNGVNAGVLVNTRNQATAIGSLSVDGSLPLTGGLLQVGQMFLAGRGSLAEGTVEIGGDAGTAGGLLIVGCQS